MSLQEIKVARQSVLDIVRENKEKHDTILKDAVNGYWINAEAHLKKYEKDTVEALNKAHRARLKALRKQHKEELKNLKANLKSDLTNVTDKTRDKGFFYWHGKYPEDHSDDYLGTIRRLELCVENEVNLNNNEFDSYIRNKWSWKESFISSNRGYANSYWTTGSCFNSQLIPASVAISGSTAINSTLASF